MDKNYNKEDIYYGGKPRYDRRPKKLAPMAEGFAMYYIAALCPDKINAEIELFKNYLQDKYGSKAAKKSPAHLTIVPPFKAAEDFETAMLDFVMTYNFSIVPLEVQLKNFNHFGDKVLFVDVEPNDNLQQLEADANEQFVQQFPAISFRPKPVFHPHVTVATRDIPENSFDEIWSHFEHQQFEAGFTLKELAVMKLVNGTWVKL